MPEHIGEGIIEEVETGRAVEVGVSDHLRREEGLAGSGPEEGSVESVVHVHPVDHPLHLPTDALDVRLLLG